MLARHWNKLYKYFMQYYFYVIVFFWCSLFLYYRIFRERTSYVLSEIKNFITYKYILLHITFILFHICLIIYILYLTKQKSRSLHSKPIILQYFTKFANRLFITPFTHVRDMLAPKIPYSGVFFCNIAKFVEKKGLWTIKLFLIVFHILPKMIVCSIFVIEIVFYHRIHYFLSSLSLLLIPLICSIFINIFSDFGRRGLIDIPKYVNIIPLGDSLPNGWYKRYRFEPKPEFKYNNTTVQEYQILYFLCINIWGYGEVHMKGFLEKVNPYITIGLSSCYIIATTYKLFLLLA